ncbi:hypothetical protein CAPTEDRAFT_214386 [Capitella teleta]|uniref:Alkylated DNA repair protein AlkB homologue 8 N-terminal domain-containing protein n=1 Tax=Capitella teleta TaxID=283909 RepID=R7TGF5_CAPTE|nr:hypothetical protein CAPTEDRAFT_214386 [Capitella teleta]|eukprot:ELT92784.1 hypothetical protein CAPTEDRAFT_214386 [Capitella teleta]
MAHLSDIDIALYDIPGFHGSHANRNNLRKGGVAIFARNDLDLTPLIEEEAIYLIEGLKPKRSVGEDNISTQFIKHIKSAIAKPLCILINQSFSEGVFPRLLKKSKVLPIFEKKDRHCMDNYCPIALASSFLCSAKSSRRLSHPDFLHSSTPIEFSTNPNMASVVIGALQTCTKSRTQLKDLNLTIGSKQIERVSDFNFLWIVVDDKLSWKAHLAQLHSKLGRGLYMLWRVRSLTSKKGLVSLYHSLIHSHLTYGSLLWGSASLSTLKRVITLQKKAIRVVHNAQYNAHILLL